MSEDQYDITRQAEAGGQVEPIGEAMSNRDERDFKPGSKVIRMGDSAASLGLHQFEVYEVEAWNPHPVDGLELKGVRGRWNSQNFELLGENKEAPPAQS